LRRDLGYATIFRDVCHASRKRSSPPLSGHGEKAMADRMGNKVCAIVLAAALGVSTAPARAELTEEQLAKLAQNPVGNLISVPFQNNANLNFGPENGTQDVLNIQPVIPISLNKDWNIITRTILPVVWLPPLAPGDSRTSGISDLQFNAFLSPAEPGQWIWGRRDRAGADA
jgi:hypothetical protein